MTLQLSIDLLAVQPKNGRFNGRFSVSAQLAQVPICRVLSNTCLNPANES